MTRIANTGALLHVRYSGRSFDVPLEVLDVTADSGVRQIKQALAAHLDVAEAKFNDYVVDVHANGNITLRPEAVFG
ncbi:MAG TPA: hypothetical protein VHM90_22780 [Phycisphaerae bacterium]|nr:hypothetical protein [Phycisphaerae bacterium]